MKEEKTSPLDLPERVEKRLNIWRRAFRNARRVYFSVGIFGAAFSAVAATNILGFSQYLSAAAAVCFAIFGFAQPEQRYLKYVRAWRVLDIAACRYCHKLIEVTDLFTAMEEAEKIIGEFEIQAQVPSTSKSPT